MIYHIVIAPDFSERWIPPFGPMLWNDERLLVALTMNGRGRSMQALSAIHDSLQRHDDFTSPEKPATASRLSAHPTTDWK
jgi:hypothetical protein